MTGPRIGLAVMFLLLAFPFAYFLLPVPVTGRSLTHSIERATDSAGLTSECSEVRDGRWHCNLNDASGSGTSDYSVATGWSCWRGRQALDRPEVPMPERPEGCARLRDLLGLWDLVTGDG